MGAPAVCIIRILHQLASKAETIENLACANNDVIALLTRSLGAPGNLHKESTFIVEVMKKIFTCIMCRSMGFFVQAAMNCKLPSFLLDNIIGATNNALKDVRNASALRIHAVDVIKAIMAADEGNAVGLQAMLDLHHAWSEFRDQSHDLFITVKQVCSVCFAICYIVSFWLQDAEKTDVFLIMDASDTRFTNLLITDGRDTTNVSQYFTSTTTATSTNVQGSYENPYASTSAASGGVNVPPPAPTPAPAQAPAGSSARAPAPAAAPASAPAAGAAVGSSSRGPVSPVTPPAGAVPPAPTGSATPGKPAATKAPAGVKPASPTIFKTTVVKGDLGIGLDLSKNVDGGVSITRLKEMPPGVVNPASQCNPPIASGDIIIGVNGQMCTSFNDVVKLIRAAPMGPVQLSLQRV
jgi:hypothetical protein